MGLEDLISRLQKDHARKYKGSNAKIDVAAKEDPPTGLIVDNPLLEYILDRRFIAYGRCYLLYGRKGSAKTTLLNDLIKMFQSKGGEAFLFETENAYDTRYAELQGVDMDRLVLQHPETLEEGLAMVESVVKNLPKAYPEGDTPILIAMDSIGGATPEYETQDKIAMGATQVGLHAKLMSNFYRRICRLLPNEKAIFVGLNQLKFKIGNTMPGMPPSETLLGGDAQFFHSTLQCKLTHTGDMVFTDDYGAKRVFGSTNSITCKRNKLGRAGRGQGVQFHNYAVGGIDWFSPLVIFLDKNYSKHLVTKDGQKYKWRIPECTYVDDEGQEKTIDPNDRYSSSELGIMISRSEVAKEEIRKVFGIPELLDREVIEKVEAKKKRNRRKKVDDDEKLDDVEIVESSNEEKDEIDI